jgi:ribosome recycling factor
MDDRVKKMLDETKSKMDKAITHMESELTKVRAGKATPSLLDSVRVDYYGSMMPLSQVANVNNADARTLVIQPWEKTMLGPIEKAITLANLGFNPQNDGVIVRIAVPALTEDRRKDLVKRAKTEAESGRVAIRTIRKDAMEAGKALLKAGLPEDEAKDCETRVQKLTDECSVKIDKLIELKEKDIMTV